MDWETSLDDVRQRKQKHDTLGPEVGHNKSGKSILLRGSGWIELMQSSGVSIVSSSPFCSFFPSILLTLL